jgi:hypothetical protein
LIVTNFLNELIISRIKDLGLSRRDFICRLGYQNIPKGERRLRSLEAGDLSLAKKMKVAIASASQVPVGAVEEAISAEWDARRRRDDEAYRATFRPHAVLRTTQSIPSPITIAGLINAEKGLFVSVPEDIAADQYAGFVAESLPEGVPCYGRVTGFVLNYSPDHAVEFDLTGNPIREFDRAVRVGQSSARLGGRVLPSGIIGWP